MPRPDFNFEITRKVSIHVDFAQSRAVISCKTKDGKSIHLNADFKTLEKIHEQIRNKLEPL